MLKFYYHPLSPIARRVWLALLEKDICFEPILVDLKARENLKRDYLVLNPFHHVPVIVDGDTRILESFAILDYLEAKFPIPSLSPTTPVEIAQMRMIQMAIANELMPKLPALVFSGESTTDRATLRQVSTVLTFLSAQLGTDNYFGGNRISLADITAGAALPLIERLGFDLQEYPAIGAWCVRVMEREAWRQTEPEAEALNAWKRWVTRMVQSKAQNLPVSGAQSGSS